MSKGKPRNSTFKAKMAIEAIKERKTVSQPCYILTNDLSQSTCRLAFRLTRLLISDTVNGASS